MHQNIVHRPIYLVINLTNSRLNGRARHDLLMPYIV